jgi:hypothetical protein
LNLAARLARPCAKITVAMRCPPTMTAVNFPVFVVVGRQEVELHLRVKASSLALRTQRTRWLQVDCGAL